MGYELLLVPVPPGADVEEAGEALLARLTSGHERTRLTTDGRARARLLAQRLVAAEPELAPAASSQPAEGAVELRTPTGLVVTLADRFARFLVPFAYEGDAAVAAFRQLFALLGVAAEATGWRPYDPQEGEGVGLGADAEGSVLEIYLSVMDQLRPVPPAQAQAPA